MLAPVKVAGSWVTKEVHAVRIGASHLPDPRCNRARKLYRSKSHYAEYDRKPLHDFTRAVASRSLWKRLLQWLKKAFHGRRNQ